MPTPARPKVLRDRALGALWGVAVGDALGATVEFMSADAIAARHGVHSEIVGGGAFNWRPGQGTDDTDLTYAVLSAYAEHPFTSLEHFAANFAAWYRTRPRDIGGTTARALRAVSNGDDPHTTGQTGESSQGNGSLMRAIPTAIVRAPSQFTTSTGTLDRLIKESKAISAITHAHDNCIWACVAYNQLAAALMVGMSVDNALTYVNSSACPRPTRMPEVEAALQVNPETPVEQIPTSGWVIDSLRAAVWAIQQPSSFEETLVALVNRGDDADTTGAIAGGLLGAAKGATTIPQRWIDVIEYRDKLDGDLDVLLPNTSHDPTGHSPTPAIAESEGHLDAHARR